MLWKLLNKLKFESSKAAPGKLVAALQITFIGRHLPKHTNHIQWLLTGIITKDAFVPRRDIHEFVAISNRENSTTCA